MANNRMFLRCRKCGDGFMLGKTYGASYYMLDSYCGGKSFIEAFNDFCKEHTFCEKELCKNSGYYEPKFLEPKEDIWGENQFEIAYEFFED